MPPSGKVYPVAHQEPLRGLHSVGFPQHLLRVVGERLRVIWDRSPIHRRAVVRKLVAGTRG